MVKMKMGERSNIYMVMIFSIGRAPANSTKQRKRPLDVGQCLLEATEQIVQFVELDIRRLSRIPAKPALPEDRD